MSERELLYKAEQKILDEIENEKHKFSFRNIINLFKANCIAEQLR